ncbi:MAG: carboxypeptidase regulatory-like domain-containing protein, partial [Armatimonadota bacterium]|nr:carboxypeptidase regulatory-like domain-containing protein [Armatimonadota bacterium]
MHAPGPGAYWVNIRPNGDSGDYETYDEPLTLAARGPSLQLSLKLRTPLRLKLQAPGGGPVTGPVQAWMWILWGDRKAAMRGVTRTASPEGGLTLPPPPGVKLSEVKKAYIELRAGSNGGGLLRLQGWPGDAQTLTLERGATLAGTVLDSAGKPVAGSKVRVYRTLGESFLPTSKPIETTTDAAGVFQVASLLHGGYFVRVEPGAGKPILYSHATIVGDRTDIKLQASEKPASQSMWEEMLPMIEQFPVPYATAVQLVDPEVARGFLPLTGRFTDGVTHAPVPGAFIFLTSKGNGMELVDVGVTHPDGSFHLSAPLAGDYELGSQSENYGYFSQNVTLPVVSTTPLELTLHPSPTVKVRLVTADGKPLPPGTVDLSAQIGSKYGGGQSAQANVKVGADGAAELQFPKGGGQPNSTDPVLLVTAISTTAGLGQTRMDHMDQWKGGPVTIHMQPGWNFHGTALNTAGHPVAGANVELKQWMRGVENIRGTFGDVGSTRTDAEGKFHFPVLPNITCFVNWTAPGETPHAVVVTFSRPETTAILTPLHLMGSAETAAQQPWMLEQVMGPLLPPLGIEAPKLGPPVAIAGHVVGQPGGKPLADAQVLLFGSENTAPLAFTRTAADGTFKLEAPGSGAYSLAAAWNGYLAGQFPVQVPVAGLKAITLQAPEEPAIRLALLDPSGKPLVGGQALLQMEGHSSTELLVNISLTSPIGAKGLAAFRPTYTGSLRSITDLRLWVRVEGVGCALVSLNHWPAAPIPVRLDRGNVISGEVVDGAGRLLPRVTVTATRLRPETYN